MVIILGPYPVTLKIMPQNTKEAHEGCKVVTARKRGREQLLIPIHTTPPCQVTERKGAAEDTEI